MTTILGGIARDAQRSREAILAAAEQAISAHGFDAMTMQAVGEAAGLSRGAPAYFFGTKPALQAAALERCVARLRAAVDAPLQADVPATAVAELVGRLHDAWSREPDAVRVLQHELLRPLGAEPVGLPELAGAMALRLRTVLARAGGEGPSEAALADLAATLVAALMLPLVHPLVPPGVDAASPSMAADRRAHLVGVAVRSARALHASRGA